MARIGWALMCELAFFDQQHRLCMIGIVRQLPTPQLPLAVNQMMLVAHLTDIRTVEQFEIAVSVMTPSGLLTSATGSGCVVIEIAHDYVLVTLREIPLKEEGLYRFQVALTGQSIASIDVPVKLGRALSVGGH